MPCVLSMSEKAKDNDNDQIDSQGNHGSHGCCSDNNIIREVNFSQKVTTANYRLHANGSCLREETPKAGAAEERDGEGWCSIREFQKPDENGVHDSEEHQWLEDRPRHA